MHLFIYKALRGAAVLGYRKPLFIIIEVISKIVDHAQRQGASLRESEAYTLVCEHFEMAFNAAFEC